MYWGLVLKTNKRYSQQITKGFHVSNATLDLSTVEKDTVVSIWVNTDDSEHLLCNLSKQIPQVALDLVFSEGEAVAFYSKGNGTVHLNGNIMQDDEFGIDDMGDSEELEEEDEDEEIDSAELKKLMKKDFKSVEDKKLSDADKEDSDEDSDDDEDDVLGKEENSDEDSDMEDSDEDMSDDDDEDDDDDDDEIAEDEEEEISAPPSKKGKMEKEPKQNGVVINGKSVQKKNEQKKNDQMKNDQKKKQNGASQEHTKKEKKEQQPQQKSGKRTLTGGVIIEDLNQGKGPEATAGKRLSVYYVGRLQKTNKVFDSTQSGDGFKFTLGKNEVIRGWDIGLVGMRVGGKRRIVCPPNAAYGAKGAPPAIPGHATLVFDVTLRAIH